MKNLWYTLTWKTHFWIWVLNNQFLKKENGKSSYFSVWDDIQYIQNRSNHFRSDSFISTLSLQRWRFDNFFNIEILIRISAIQQKECVSRQKNKNPCWVPNKTWMWCVVVHHTVRGRKDTLRNLQSQCGKKRFPREGKGRWPSLKPGTREQSMSTECTEIM